MALRDQIMSRLERLSLDNWTAKKLAVSFCVGTYIAFSPFPGFHTWLSLLLAWMFSLNVAVVFAASIFINNPWTMVFIYGGDYFFGDFILRFFMIDTCSFDPHWMCYVNTFLHTYTGLEHISLWSFLLGGNIIAVAASFVAYPIAKHIFVEIKKKKQGSKAS
jgi:uncharacterized protein